MFFVEVEKPSSPHETP
jgi:hypothetical protein